MISGFHLISFTDQGIYDLVNNLGSTAARLLFSPMEESCHFVFNQCLVRDMEKDKQDLSLLKDVLRLLRTVLRTCSLVGWIGVTFAQANSCLLLYLYTGPSLAENKTAVSLLRLFSFYVLLLAWNGSTEAFLNAAMSTNEVARHNKRLVLFSIVFLGANGLFVPKLGVHGFVLANCINMISRISYSCWFIRHYLQRQKNIALKDQEPTTSDATTEASHWLTTAVPLLRLMLPSLKEMIVFALSLAITVASEKHFCCMLGWKLILIHTGITSFTLLSVLFLLHLEESDLWDLFQTGLGKTKSE
ncbi:unnamed protein product [Echinostoma caproni]|uniref:Protein RFT1 homolog n=1 Tax=Echinostoma caproni TaxID=27848 RepID=A0A3P8K063_9TREM|nr:unnamed protein product [Echinostoma caproni]